MHDMAAMLSDFYASPLGSTARRIVARRVRARWPNVTGMDVVGVGYAAPYLRMFQHEARAAVSLMPEEQGIVRWPEGEPCRTAIVPEIRLPLRDMSTEYILGVHSIEHVEARAAYLREIWRVLMPQGRVIFVVPNRRGPWARLETTPFGHGRPYSPSQLEKLLRNAMLQPVGLTHCLFLPPFRFRAVGPAILAWERFGGRLWPAFSGLIIVEAIKLVYAGIRAPAAKPVFIKLPAIAGLQPARDSRP